MAKAICKDYASLHHVENDHPLDASDVQELRVRVQRRQGVIYPEQEPRFRNLDRLALQGKLTAAVLSEAARTLSLFQQPGPLGRGWAKAELLADLALPPCVMICKPCCRGRQARAIVEGGFCSS